jgi:hypothetical protein
VFTHYGKTYRNTKCCIDRFTTPATLVPCPQLRGMNRDRNTSPATIPMLPMSGKASMRTPETADSPKKASSEADKETYNHTSDKREESPKKRQKMQKAEDTTTKLGKGPLPSVDQEDQKPAAVTDPTVDLSTLLTPSNIPLPRAEEPKGTHMAAFGSRFVGENKVRKQVSTKNMAHQFYLSQAPPSASPTWKGP